MGEFLCSQDRTGAWFLGLFDTALDKHDTAVTVACGDDYPKYLVMR